jgi:hypothetical protein
MRKSLNLLPLACALFPVVALAICPTSTCPPDGTQSSGAKYRICMPDAACWNGNLVVFAHGYIAPNSPIAIPDDQLTINGLSLPRLTNELGYGFAVSSYSTNGLAILQGIQDSEDLVNIFSGEFGKPQRVYIVGASEGGLVSALSIEQLSSVYSAALPACGPIGNFRLQVNYIGDFRVIFDYFFPGVIPGSPVSIPSTVIDNWNSVYVPAIQNALQANPSATAQLQKVTGFPIGPDANTTAQAMIELLWYSAFSTNDAVAKLGGQPYDNRTRIYSGSSNDLLLNLKVARFSADANALAEIAAHYQTTGKLSRPAVTLHTTGDPIVPYVHEPLYTLKTLLSGTLLQHVNVPSTQYGHCNFKGSDILTAFGLMVFKDTGKVLSGAETVLPEDQRKQFTERAKEFGLPGR